MIIVRILWLLEEFEIPYEIKHYKRGADQLAPKELREVHPLGKSPMITDTERGNQVVIESGAIIRTQFSEASLMSTLVLRFIMTVVPTQAPFFVRPLVHMITGQVTSRFTDPDLKRKIEYVATTLEKQSPDGRAWFAGGDKDGKPTAADFQMLFPMEAMTSPKFDPNMVPASIKNWVDMVHQRPAYRRAYEKGGPYDYAKL